MTLFFSLLPLYLLGNLHCFGMCGPLVMLLGKHRFRYWYFLGRCASFTLAGFLAGFFGGVLQGELQEQGVSFALSFFLGLTMVFFGAFIMWKKGVPGGGTLSRLLAPINRQLSMLMLKDKAFPVFLFGFFTVALPCGQTIIVFSACALALDPEVGAFNGLAFALLTSPSLFFAMQAKKFFSLFRKWEGIALGGCSIFVGVLAMLRGLADVGVIQHMVISAKYHVVLY